MQAISVKPWKLLDPAMSEPECLSFAGGGVAYFTAPCPERDGTNEDAAGLFAVGTRSGALVVADGMGGTPAGGGASRLAVESVEKALSRIGDDPDNLRSPMLDALESCNRALLDRGSGSGTTFAALEIQDDRVRSYHVGDTSILLTGQRGKLKMWTVPHSPTGYAVEAGMLCEREALYHDERHVVSNSVGSPDMRIEIGSPMRLAKRDTALLATDGLFDNLSLDEIVELIRIGTLEKAACGLVELAQRRMSSRATPNAPCKPDDLTVMLYRRD